VLDPDGDGADGRLQPRHGVVGNSASGLRGTVTSGGLRPLRPSPFASIQGSLVRLAPQRSDSGSYSLTIQVTAGGQTATASIAVEVSRFNTAPAYIGYNSTGMQDDGLFRGGYCPGGACHIDGVAAVIATACDAEGDRVLADIEVVAHGGSTTACAA